ncbi:apoptosis regulatory protein Siva [Augochlora pura]
MPKRACPFEDDLSPQLKIHVRQRHVDNGICQEEQMKIVYGRTMDLLKEGVKSLSRKLNSSMDMNSTDLYSLKVTSPRKNKQKHSSKQMVLNSKLELLGMDKAIRDVQPKYDLCGCTRVIDQNIRNKCSYCDQVLCNSCLVECISCTELFCQNCSLPVYDYEERSKCFNCYK